MGKTSCLLPILNQDPHHHNCQGPLAVLQGSGREEGVCVRAQLFLCVPEATGLGDIQCQYLKTLSSSRMA